MRHLQTILALPLLLAAAPALAADRHVPAQFATIQAAVDAAVNGDRVLVADGVYAGSGNVDINPGGKAITIMSVSGPAACTLDGAPTPGAHAFLLISGEQSGTVIEGFTVSGFATTAGDEGAVRLVGTSPGIRNCVFTGCTTAAPGAATPPGSVLKLIDGGGIVRDCLFEHNEGSAVHTDADSVVYIIDSTFQNNEARTTDGRGGGAVLNDGFTLTFTSFYRNNRVVALAGPARGGAFAHFGLVLDLTTATFDGNEVIGPGEHAGAAVYATSDLIMNGNVVTNHAGQHVGGAIHVDATHAKEILNGVTSAVYHDNAVGGIHIEGPPALLDVRIGSSDFCGNTPFDIEGPFVDWSANHICCPADVDTSGTVNVDDLVDLISSWGACDGCPADIDGDGAVTVDDLVALITTWGACPELPEAAR